MKKSSTRETAEPQHLPAAINGNASSATAEIRDNRGITNQQMKLAARIDNSPLMSAQRKQLKQTAAPGGETVQRQNRKGLPDNLKAGIESLSGIDMSDVQVHKNSARPAQLNALAYA